MALCSRLVDELEQALRLNLEGPSARRPLGLATGRTMEPLYAALVAVSYTHLTLPTNREV